MYFRRSVDIYLREWMEEEGRKPLLIRGARQVGKSSAVKNLSKEFQYFIHIDLVENREIATLFDQSISIDEICNSISIISKTPIIDGKTLLFIDEIQASLSAISLLRYFYEKRANLHVVAAGSLLEFALEELPSLGVGRLRSLFIYPFSFSEFLWALGHDELVEKLCTNPANTPLSTPVHSLGIEMFKKFLILGGMPEVIATYVKTNDLLKCQRILDDLIISLQDDFAKYKKRVNLTLLKEVFQSAVLQQGCKFVYTRASNSNNLRQVKEALMQLQLAGLIIPVTHTSANGIPLGAEINPRIEKQLIFDTGIYQRLSGLDLSVILLDPDFVNKGAIAEQFVGLELLKSLSPYIRDSLYYWQREAKNSQAELDYIIQKNGEIIPLEVKSGTKGTMKSLHIFLQEKNRPYGVRLSLENFGTIDKIKIVPIYAAFLLTR